MLGFRKNSNSRTQTIKERRPQTYTIRERISRKKGAGTQDTEVDAMRSAGLFIDVEIPVDKARILRYIQVQIGRSDIGR